MTCFLSLTSLTSFKFILKASKLLNYLYEPFGIAAYPSSLSLSVQYFNIRVSLTKVQLHNHNKSVPKYVNWTYFLSVTYACNVSFSSQILWKLDICSVHWHRMSKNTFKSTWYILMEMPNLPFEHSFYFRERWEESAIFIWAVSLLRSKAFSQLLLSFLSSFTEGFQDLLFFWDFLCWFTAPKIYSPIPLLIPAAPGRVRNSKP